MSELIDLLTILLLVLVCTVPIVFLVMGAVLGAVRAGNAVKAWWRRRKVHYTIGAE